MNKKTIWLCALTCLLLFGWTNVSAQGTIQVQENSIDTTYPETVDFQLDVSSQDEIESITLIYGSNARSCQSSGSRQPVDFEGGTEVSVTWEWELQRSGSLPPDSLIWWEWEIKDVAGNTLRTERVEMPFPDDRYRWRSVSGDGVTVHWYWGDQVFGEETHANTLASLARLQELMGVPIPDDIHLWVYPTAAEVRDALALSSEWTGAVAFSRYATMLISLEPGEDAWGDEVIAHELTHLAVGLAIFNCRGGYLPVWLNEGLAVFGEPEVDSKGGTNVHEALAADRLPPLRSLADGFSAYGDGARLAYAQSGEVVRYLIAEYGPETMNDLMMTVREGITIDQALEQVYGLDTDQLDAMWRQSTGFPATPTKEASGDDDATPTLVPTLALGGVPMVAATATATASTTPPPDTPIPTIPPPPTLTPTLTPATTVPSVTTAQVVAAISTPTQVNERLLEVENGQQQSDWIWWIAGLLIIIIGTTTVLYLRKQKGG